MDVRDGILEEQEILQNENTYQTANPTQEKWHEMPKRRNRKGGKQNQNGEIYTKRNMGTAEGEN